MFHLQKVLGHSSLEMTRRYDNRMKEFLQAIHQRACLIGEKALLTIALYFAQKNYVEMLKDKPRLYIVLHGLLTFSRTFRATLRARWAELLGWGPVLSASERARAVELIQTADLSVPLG